MTGTVLVQPDEYAVAVLTGVGSAGGMTILLTGGATGVQYANAIVNGNSRYPYEISPSVDRSITYSLNNLNLSATTFYLVALPYPLDFIVGQSGPVNVDISDTNGAALLAATPADGQTPTSGLLVVSRPEGYNGATWDRWQNNAEGNLLASAGRTTRQTAALAANPNGQGIMLALTTTVQPNTAETLTLAILATVNGQVSNFPLAKFTTPAGSTLQGTFTFILIVHPGASGTLPDTTNYGALAMSVPRNGRYDVNPSSTGSWTYRLDYVNLL